MLFWVRISVSDKSGSAYCSAGIRSSNPPVSSSERHAALLPDDVRFGASSHLALKHDTSSFHQLLVGGLLDEEGSGGGGGCVGLADAHL